MVLLVVFILGMLGAAVMASLSVGGYYYRTTVKRRMRSGRAIDSTQDDTVSTDVYPFRDFRPWAILLLSVVVVGVLGQTIYTNIFPVTAKIRGCALFDQKETGAYGQDQVTTTLQTSCGEFRLEGTSHLIVGERYDIDYKFSPTPFYYLNPEPYEAADGTEKIVTQAVPSGW